MWDDLDHYTTYCPTYMLDTIEYKKHVESIQIFEFLAGLNSEYEHVQVLLLGKHSLPSLNEVYAYIHREEGHQGVMNVSSFEKSALISTSNRGDHGVNNGRGRGGRMPFTSDDQDRLKCNHCDRWRHTKDQCWDLHGQPHEPPLHSSLRGGSSSGRGGGQLGANNSMTSTPTKMVVPTSLPPNSLDGGLSKEEIEAFRCFVSHLNHPFNAPSSSFAYSGTSTSILSASVSSHLSS